MTAKQANFMQILGMDRLGFRQPAVDYSRATWGISASTQALTFASSHEYKIMDASESLWVLFDVEGIFYTMQVCQGPWTLSTMCTGMSKPSLPSLRPHTSS